MNLLFRLMSATRPASFFLFLLLVRSEGAAQKRISCLDGDHLEIDVKQIRIDYDASSFAGTLSGLGALGARMEVAPKKLQEAAAATQQWDELLKGLAVGYNTCAVTRQQYADGLKRIYPRLKEDAADLEEIRKVISDGRKADEKRLQNLLEGYYSNLRQFAQSAGKEIILERIEAVSEQVSNLQSGQAKMLEGQQQQITVLEAIQARVNELTAKSTQAPVPTPAQVGNEITELRKSLVAKADEAEAAYKKGYTLLDQFRFQEAIPYLQQAIADVPLSDFYEALGRAYAERPDLDQAERVLRDGLILVGKRNDEKAESGLSNQLGIVLLLKGDLEGALSYTRQALKIDEKVYGPDHPTVANAANNIGMILEDKGDLEGALSYTQRALKIDEKVYGPDHPTVANVANNIGTILEAKGDLEGALSYTQRALKIDEKVYGPDHPTVANAANNIGQILQAKGDLEGALSYTQRALKIDVKVYGLDHPNVATDANNIGQILQAKGDLEGALSYTQQALKILRNSYGLTNPLTKVVAANLERIKQARQQ